MHIYQCPICQNRTAGKRSAGWYIWLIIGLFAAPLGIGILILICLPFVDKHCTYCNVTLPKTARLTG